MVEERYSKAKTTGREEQAVYAYGQGEAMMSKRSPQHILRLAMGRVSGGGEYRVART